MHMDLDREEILEKILEAVAEYKDMDISELDGESSFADLELEPGDVLSIVREVTEQVELDPPKGFEFTQTIEELVDFLCS